MPLNITHPDAERLARELARRQGKSITEAVIGALEAELARERHRVRSIGLADRLKTIGERSAALPTYDTRSDDEILGYDEDGLPN